MAKFIYLSRSERYVNVDHIDMVDPYIVNDELVGASVHLMGVPENKRCLCTKDEMFQIILGDAYAFTYEAEEEE